MLGTGGPRLSDEYVTLELLSGEEDDDSVQAA
jgi:hypothetical protein